MNTNDTITRINYKSDFDFTLELHGAGGTAIGFPACDFAGRLYTFCSANQYRFSCIGGEAVNCYDDGGRLHVVVNSHTMGCGRMRLELTLHVPDALYPDGERRTVTRLTLPLELVSGATTLPDSPVGDFAVTLPVVLNTTINDMPQMVVVAPEEEQPEIELRLDATDDGKGLRVSLSRELNDDEGLCLLTRGASRCSAQFGINENRIYYKSKNRWHLNKRAPVNIVDGVITELPGGESDEKPYAKWLGGSTSTHNVMKIRKANSSRFILPAKKGIKGRITYGLAVYRLRDENGKWRVYPERLSNVCYFKSCVEVLNDAPPHSGSYMFEPEEGTDFIQWFETKK